MLINHFYQEFDPINKDWCKYEKSVNNWWSLVKLEPLLKIMIMPIIAKIGSLTYIGWEASQLLQIILSSNQGTVNLTNESVFLPIQRRYMLSCSIGMRLQCHLLWLWNIYFDSLLKWNESRTEAISETVLLSIAITRLISESRREVILERS